MEVIKRKILLENSIDRTNPATWGTLTATTFYINIMLTQNIDDMGLFTDMTYIPLGDSSGNPPDYTILIDKLNASGYTFNFMTGATVTALSKIASDYYVFGNLPLTGATDSKIEDVRSYDTAQPFKVGFNTGAEVYINYSGGSINGVNRVTSISDPRIYVFDTLDNPNIGTNNQIYGSQYLDYSGETRQVLIDGVLTTIPLTTFRYIGEGWNETNVSLSASTKEEYLFGIISPPEVQSDVFIDRGITTVMDKHLKMSEIKSLDALSSYGNGFYKLNKQ